MYDVQGRFIIIFQTVCQITLCTLGQMTDVGFVVKSFPQIGLIEPAVISYAENKAGSCRLDFYYWVICGMDDAGEAEKSCQ